MFYLYKMNPIIVEKGVLRKNIVQYLYFTVLQYQKNWTVQESDIAVWLHSQYIAQH